MIHGQVVISPKGVFDVARVWLNIQEMKNTFINDNNNCF